MQVSTCRGGRRGKKQVVPSHIVIFLLNELFLHYLSKNHEYYQKTTLYYFLSALYFKQNRIACIVLDNASIFINEEGNTATLK